MVYFSYSFFLLHLKHLSEKPFKFVVCTHLYKIGIYILAFDGRCSRESFINNLCKFTGKGKIIEKSGEQSNESPVKIDTKQKFITSRRNIIHEQAPQNR